MINCKQYADEILDSITGTGNSRSGGCGSGSYGRCCLSGNYAPSTDVGIPATIIFARLDIDRHIHLLAHLQRRCVLHAVAKERNAHLARKLLRQLEDYLLTLPIATSRSAFCGRHYLVNYAFKFHNLCFLIV